MTVKFIHYRYMDKNDLQPRPTGGVTVAYDRLENNEVEYAFARCNDKDHYNKHFGAVKAQGRLKSNRYRRKFSLEGKDPIVVQVLSHVFDEISTELHGVSS